MKNKSCSENQTFFMSWSDTQSKEVAYVIRTLLCRVFMIPEEDIFISDSDLTGKGSMVDKISEIASKAKAEIICLTKDNCSKPWIHYELGISSCMEHHKMILPICFNLSPKDIPSHLSMITQKEVICANETAGCKIGDMPYYEELLKRLLFHTDKFLVNEMPGVYRQNNFKNTHDHEIEVFSTHIKKAAKELRKIFQKYDGHDYYISRPMQGVDDNINHQISDILCRIGEGLKNKKRIYFAGNKPEHVNLPLSRIDIIKTSNSFILIYPRIPESIENVAPSSCFVELGAAMARSIDIKIFAQQGSKLPEFLNDKYKAFSIDYFGTIDEVYRLILDYIKKN